MLISNVAMSPDLEISVELVIKNRMNINLMQMHKQQHDYKN